MGMGRSFHHWGAREQFLWGWGGRSTTGERGSSSHGDGEVVPPLGSEGAVLMGIGRSFHHWGAREQFSWGWGGPPLGSEGAVLMGMGRSFHHWGAREQFSWGWGGPSTTGERGSSSYGDGEVVPPLGSEGGRSTTGERGSSSYGDGEVVPPLGSEGAVLMGMGRSFHHWGARDNSRPDVYLLRLLEISLTKNDFEFNKEFFLQISGTAMGKICTSLRQHLHGTLGGDCFSKMHQTTHQLF